MAKTFNKLKDPRLALTDLITFGKLKDCRVCDVIEDHYEYLIWGEKQGYLKFQDIVIEAIQEAAHYEKWQPPEDTNKHQDLYEKISRIDYDWEDDIPF